MLQFRNRNSSSCILEIYVVFFFLKNLLNYGFGFFSLKMITIDNINFLINCFWVFCNDLTFFSRWVIFNILRIFIHFHLLLTDNIIFFFNFLKIRFFVFFFNFSCLKIKSIFSWFFNILIRIQLLGLIISNNLLRNWLFLSNSRIF